MFVMATEMGDACPDGRLLRYVTVLLLMRQHPLLSSFSNPPPGSISPPSGLRQFETPRTRKARVIDMLSTPLPYLPSLICIICCRPLRRKRSNKKSYGSSLCRMFVSELDFSSRVPRRHSQRADFLTDVTDEQCDNHAAG